MKVEYTTQYIDGMAFEMVLDGHHKLVMDAEENVGGQDRGPRPKQLLISALTGCTGMDVVSILKKMQVKFSRFTMRIETELTEEHPKTYSKIHMIYEFGGDNLESSRSKFEKAVNLSQERYCGVSALLDKVVQLTSEIRLLED
ncbi:MAG: OsmC family protein [Tissierellales bacterium]|nr:OsmC family protein [Tissierellales bacterium]MBN2827503.1 OsmC family protein [Tissierellales bacterium]